MPAAILEWTDERTQTLTTMWKAGHSASEIAEEIGTTRNAILGRIFKLGLSRKPGAERKAQLAQAAQKMVAKPMEAPLRAPTVKRVTNAVWSLPDGKRRAAFARRSAKAARAALMEMYVG